MSSYNTYTNTNTYTVVDIRKTFEGFSADLNMIALRTGKMTTEYAEKIIHDILKLAESKYLQTVDITLLDASDKPIKASKYTVNDSGSALNSQRPGGNNWPNEANTTLKVIVYYNSDWFKLTEEQKAKFYIDKGFKLSWSKSLVDNNYSHLQTQSGQLYGSNGYELQKQNFN